MGIIFTWVVYTTIGLENINCDNEELDQSTLIELNVYLNYP